MSLLDTLLRLPDSKKVSQISSPTSPTPPDGSKPGAVDPANEALDLINRLKCYTLPAGRIPAARVIAERLAARVLRWEEHGEPVFESDDSAAILAVLRDIEGELIILGGAPDLLAESVEMVKRTFPGSRLVEVRKRLK